MIRKSVKRFSEMIMPEQELKRDDDTSRFGGAYAGPWAD
jgi:hypothetical protein